MVKSPTNLQTPKLRWFQFRLRTIFTVVTIVAVQCAVCFPMLREWKSRTASFKKLRQVGLALHNYEGNSVRRFPATIDLEFSGRQRWVIGSSGEARTPVSISTAEALK
jgi:hypothetical protein